MNAEILKSKFNIGSLSTFNSTVNRSIVVYVIKDKQIREEVRSDSSLSNILEPLGYPLFFVNGENAWSWKHDQKIIDLRSYICSKIFVPENDEHNDFILRRNKLNTKDLKKSIQYML
jgi:hypothetical protein